MASTEKTAAEPRIYLDGKRTERLKLLMIEDNLGEKPSVAYFQYVWGRDVTAPTALIPADQLPPEPDPDGSAENFPAPRYGMRVTIQEPGSTRVVFNGWLMKRSDQGGPDKIIFQALCDKFLLQYIPVHGCLVRDSDGDLRFSPRHNTRFNPDGAWNCTGYEIPNPEGEGTITVPVFTPQAYRGSTYEAPNAAFSIDTLPTDGKHTAWTPRRALEYLTFWCNFYPWIGSFPYGMDGTECAFLADGGPLSLSWSTVTAMLGSDPGGAPSDPLDRKLQDVTIQGKTFIGSMSAVLSTTGTHALRVNYNSAASVTPSTLTGTSEVAFPMIGWSHQGDGTAIDILRSGSVGDDTCDIFDFTFDEDATVIAENVLVLGATKKVETRLEFVRTNDTEYDADSASSIVPAWTRAQEDAFRACIHGSLPGNAGNEEYAYIPYSFGDTNSFILANGTNGAPLVRPRTSEAVALARSNFPTVYRAWRVNGYNQKVQDIMTEASAGLSGGLKAPRPIMPTQIQFMVKALSGDSSTSNRMFSKLPIRIEVALDDFDGTDREWQEVPRDIGVHTTGDGTVWIDGLAEGADGLPWSIIPFNLLDSQAHEANDFETVRRIRVNCAFPTDYRTRGSNSKDAAVVLGSIRDAFDGAKLLRFIDCPGTYIDDKQNNSYPAYCTTVFGGSSGTSRVTMPLNRDLPPGSEQVHADFAATRVTAKSVNPRREASFKFWGIRTDWRAGQRISYINMNRQTPPGGGTPQLWQYNLASCCTSVTHDYINLITTVGGIATEFLAGRV